MYNPDTNSIIKALSESLHLTPNNQSQIAKKRRIKRSQLLEISKSACHSADDFEQSNRMLEWFYKLPLASRQLVLSIQNSVASTFIRQMYIKKLTEGEYEFAMIDNISKHPDQIILEENFLSKRKIIESFSYSDPKYQAEKNFENIVRLNDTEEYLDTLTIDPELCKNPEKFVEYVKMISNKQAFLVPCRCFWDSSQKKWMWEYPTWFSSSSYNSLSAWVCAGFERAIWMRYWMLTSSDPRKPGETQNFVPEDFPENFSHKENLVSFLAQLSEKSKLQVIGELDELAKIFQSVKTEIMNLSKNQINTWAYPQIARFPYFNSMTTGLFAYCNPLFGGFQLNTLRNRIQYFQSAKSVEIIIQKLKSDSSEKFIEFLSSSPLDRAITYLDIVARRVLLKIKSALTEKNAEDLIKLEETVAKPKKNDENKKKKKKRKKNKKNKHVEKTQDQDGSEIAKSLLDSIMDKLYVQAQKSEPYYTSNDSEDTQVTDEPSDFKESPNEESSKEEFKKVEIHKRKYKKPNVQQKQKITKKNPQKHNSPKVENNLPNQIHKKTPKKSFQWQSPPISAQETTVSSELEFPPLSASSFSPKNGKKLHHEILKYCKNIMKNTTEKSVTIMILINRLAECIKSLFPMVTIELFGSYRSGLALEDSDIDLAIINSGLFNRVDIQKAVLQVGETLQLFPWVSKCKAISTATIPVVKLEVNPVYICEGASAGTIMVDLSFDDAHETIQGSHLGMSTLLLTQRLLYDYPYLQYLVMVLKKLLYSHSLNSAYHGGLSSYSLNIWITAYLNITPPVDDCGHALLGFLDFYGNQFDHKRYGIDINNGGAFYVLPENHYENVVTIDPINQDNNTTRASYNITEVLKLFSRVHSKLIELKDTGKPNVLNQIFRR